MFESAQYAFIKVLKQGENKVNEKRNRVVNKDKVKNSFLMADP